MALRIELKRAKFASFFSTPEDLGAKAGAAIALEAELQREKSRSPQEAQEPDDLLIPYLDWMEQKHSSLELRGLRSGGLRVEVSLEKVYVALKGDRTHPLERAQARLALERELESLLLSGEFSREDIEQARWYLVAGLPVMLSLEARDRLSLFGQEAPETLTLGEAYRQERHLVILGDPGSGKTTLARWLALTMARAMREGAATVEVPRHLVDPATPSDTTPVDLGPPRLPVLIRVAELAQDRKAHKPARSLTEFLGHHTWQNSFPTYGPEEPGRTGTRLDPKGLHRMILKHLEAGSALVILDGLDEIPASSERDEMVDQVDEFIRQWVRSTARVVLIRESESGDLVGRVHVDEHSRRAGNRVLITSRIAGYHASPLKGDLAHVTIEPMGDAALDQFCDTWMSAVCSELRAPGESEEEVSARAAAAAGALKEQVHDPARRGVRELATNPLLASILAATFHNGHARLPEQRVELYQTTVENLVDVWHQRMGQANEALNAHEVFDVLEPLAAHIHQTSPTGLIPESRLRELITEALAASRGETAPPSARLRQTVESFLQVLREDVGLLAARGEKVYGFLHLTFQEYLAARFLVRDPRSAPDRLTDKMDDPRWREPILMALGYTAHHAPGHLEPLLLGILEHDGELRDLLPRSALLLVAALPEIRELPPGVARPLVLRLLGAYADRDGLARFEKLRETIEQAFQRLRQAGLESVVERVLREVLSDPAPAGELAAAAAALLRRLELFTPALVSSLLDALPRDSGRWGWPVSGALRDAATPPLPPDPPQAPKLPKEDPSLAQLRSALEQEVDPQRREETSRQISLLAAQHTNAVASYHRELAEYPRRREEYERAVAEQPPRLAWPLHHLRFRRAIEREPDLIARIVREPAWLRLVLALYGGLRDYRSPETMREYYEISAYLQLADEERKPFTEFYKDRWQGDDTVYQMAVYLDLRSPLLTESWKVRPRFSPTDIYRDSCLTPRLLDALRAGLPAAALVDELWALWRRGDAEERPEALVALVALGEDAAPAICEALTDPEREACGRSALARLDQVANSLRDPVARASRYCETCLRELTAFPGLDSARWQDVVAATLATAMSCGAYPLDTLRLCDGTPPEAHPYLLAEYLVYNFIGCGDDAVYNAAVAVDTLSNRKLSPEALLRALAATPMAHHFDWPVAHYGWAVEQIPPRTIDTDDIPITALSAIENVPHQISFLRTWALTIFKPILQRNPDLLPEVLALNLGDIGEHSDPVETLTSLAPDLAQLPDPRLEILRMARKVADPYHRSRALWRLAPYFAAERAEILAEARAVAEHIRPPHRRAQVLERLVHASDARHRPRLLKEGLAAVRAIEDPADRARALVRLALHLPSDQIVGVLEQALATVQRIRDERHRADTLLALQPQLAAFPALLAGAVGLATKITDSWQRARALDHQGRLLLAVHPALAATSPDAPAVWAPLVLRALLRDVERDCSPSARPGSLWGALAVGRDPQVFEKLREEGENSLLPCGRTAVQVLNQLLDSGRASEACALISWLDDPEPEALPILEGWLDREDPVVMSHAALLVAEVEGISPRTVPGVLVALNRGGDLARSRAARVIHHHAITPANPTRPLSVVGVDTVESLLAVAVESRVDAPRVSLVISWMMADLIYDSPDTISAWAEEIRQDGSRARVAEAGLAGIQAVTPSSWEALLVVLESGPARVSSALLQSVCNLIYRKRMTTGMWEGFLRVAPQVRDLPAGDWTERILLGDELAVMEAARRALEAPCTGPGKSLGDLADEILDDLSGGTWGTVLSLRNTQALWETLEKIANGNLFTSWGYRPAVYQAAEHAKGKPDLLALLLQWLTEALTKQPQDPRLYRKRNHLLLIIAAAAEQSPSMFANHADPDLLEPLLLEAVELHNSFVGRKAAISLLGFLRRVTPSVAEALQTAMRDVPAVQRGALDAALRFRKLDGDILEKLFLGLYHESAAAAYATAQLLAALGQSDQTRPTQRRQILNALAEAIRSPAPAAPCTSGTWTPVCPPSPAWTRLSIAL